MAITFYTYPKCGTCQKAKKWLDTNDVTYETVHLVENPPSKETLQAIHATSGLALKKFFNTSGMKYRELGLKDKLPNMSEDEMFTLLSSDGMLIKRPLMTDGKSVTIGFNEEQFAKVWR